MKPELFRQSSDCRAKTYTDWIHFAVFYRTIQHPTMHQPIRMQER